MPGMRTVPSIETHRTPSSLTIILIHPHGNGPFGVGRQNHDFVGGIHLSSPGVGTKTVAGRSRPVASSGINVHVLHIRSQAFGDLPHGLRSSCLRSRLGRRCGDDAVGPSDRHHRPCQTRGKKGHERKTKQHVAGNTFVSSVKAASHQPRAGRRTRVRVDVVKADG